MINVMNDNVTPTISVAMFFRLFDLIALRKG